jgi:hypothetical protein
MHWIFPSRVCKLPKWNGGRQPEAAAAHILFISYEKVNLSLLSRVCVCVCVVSVLLIMALALLWLKSVCAPMPSLSPFCLRFPFYSFIMLGNSSLFDSCSFSRVLHSLNGVTHGLVPMDSHFLHLSLIILLSFNCRRNDVVIAATIRKAAKSIRTRSNRNPPPPLPMYW